MIKIEEGAMFVADAHYPFYGKEFLELLESIKSGKLDTPQLFLMGDNFDALFGGCAPCFEFAKEAIELIDAIAKEKEVYFLEGNHDFNVRKFIPSVTVVPRGAQPLMVTYRGSRIALSHGDRYETGMKYELYTLFIRSKIAALLLKPFFGRIVKGLQDRAAHKDLCRKIKGFEKKAEAILGHYHGVDLVIEGHYHQGKKIKHYLALPSYACNQMVAVAQNGDFQLIKVP